MTTLSSPQAPGVEPAVASDDGGWRGQRAGVVALTVIAVCAGVALLRFAAPVLIPIVVAVFLFYALDPVVDRLQSWRVPRLLASALVVAAFVGAIGVGAARLWPQIEAVVVAVPAGAAKLRMAFRESRSGDSLLEKLGSATQAIDSAAAEAAPEAITAPGVVRVEVQQPWRASDWLLTQGISLLGLAGQTVTVLFLTVFLLNEDDSFKRKLVRQVETLGNKKLTVGILNEIASQFSSFIWVQALTSALVAVVTWLALSALGLHQPAVWGLFAGIMNIVPYFGALIVTAVLTAAGFIQFGTFGDAALVAGVALAITSFEGMFLTPHLLSRASSLNHVSIFVAIAFWSWAWGVIGMLLAVPLLMAIKAVCDHVEGLNAIGEFLGEDSRPSPAVPIKSD